MEPKSGRPQSPSSISLPSPCSSSGLPLPKRLPQWLCPRKAGGPSCTPKGHFPWMCLCLWAPPFWAGSLQPRALRLSGLRLGLRGQSRPAVRPARAPIADRQPRLTDSQLFLPLPRCRQDPKSFVSFPSNRDTKRGTRQDGSGCFCDRQGNRGSRVQVT